MNNTVKNTQELGKNKEEKNKKHSLIDLQIQQFLYELNEKAKKMKKNIEEQ